MGRRSLPPSLLANEDQAVAHLRSVHSDNNMGSFRGNSTSALARSTFFDLGKVKCSLFSFFILSISKHSLLQVLVKVAAL